MRELAGSFDAKGLRFAIAVSRFNERVGSALLSGARDALERHGVEDGDVTVVRVPGAFEIPLALRWLAGREPRPDALIALGALVRGETPHFDHLAAAVTRGLERLAADTGLPVANAVLTCDTGEQALDRAGGKAGNKGFDAAMTAIEMARLFRRIRSG
ncbi:MAG: 6,7-dimethyl-8-ribityllumazine synthase [Acidobacteria bacterium]|nr:MAG: 6,7-dimethyl-8-ribityllumazine synthase [Acidobacteriota bacterium]